MKIFPHRTESSRADGASKCLFPSFENDPDRTGRAELPCKEPSIPRSYKGPALRLRFPLLILTLLLAGLFLFYETGPVFADVVASGTCGDNLTWTLDDTDTLTISGSGMMDNYGGE